MIARLRTIWEEEPGVLSWSRVFSSFTVIAAIWSLVHIVLHNHALPPAADLVALGTFGGFPYAINRTAGAFEKK